MIHADAMTPKERMGAFLQGKEMDRLMVCPITTSWASRTVNMTIREFNSSGKNLADANIACFKKYGHDLVFIFTTTSTLGEAMGTRLCFPEEDAPQVETPFIQSREDLKKLKPVDPRKDGRLPVYLEGLERCVETIGDQVFMVPIIAGPFTTSAALRGTEDFVRDLYRDPEMVHTLMRATTDSNKITIDAYIKTGGVPCVVEPVATGSMISEKHFREFVLPYLSEVMSHIHSYGLPAVLHICGRTKRVIKAIADTGANVLSVDDIDLREAKGLAGDRMTLMGNVSPADGMFKGNPDVIRAMIRDSLARAHDNPKGYILGTGCEVPIQTPPENMAAFLEIGREMARLPIDLGAEPLPDFMTTHSSDSPCCH